MMSSISKHKKYSKKIIVFEFTPSLPLFRTFPFHKSFRESEITMLIVFTTTAPTSKF